MSELVNSPAWQALSAQSRALAELSISDLFSADGKRFEHFSLEAPGLFLDYSKNLVDRRTVELLVDLARQQCLEASVARMFAGEHINHTENRAALHVALRNRSASPMLVDGCDVMPAIRQTLQRIREFSSSVRDGTVRGHTGSPFSRVVNIGIGGSDLGPAMVVEALGALREGGPDMRFVSNVDRTHLVGALRGADPASTLFIVSSKTFTTQETMTNASAAKDWVVSALGPDAVGAHFAAVSTNLRATAAFGIEPRRVFEFWDWVGGRYSLWSAIGLPIALAVGMDHFESLLNGAYAMDQHFREEPPEHNLPVMMGLLGVWHTSFLGYRTQAVLPYAQSLSRFPAFLQQLDMESNGKRIDRYGAQVDYQTGPVVWGEPGTNGQHAFFQLLHQGTQIVPADFIVAARGEQEIGPHHEMLLANCLAQSQALAFGKSQQEAREEMVRSGLSAEAADRLAPYRAFPGNRPSNTIMLDQIAPPALGALIAAYEHKVLVQAVLWRINPFDQWGVELGKQLASTLLSRLRKPGSEEGLDSSTRGLIRRVQMFRNDAAPASGPG